MHSHDATKDPEQFEREVEEVIEQAGKGTADFSKVVFLSMPQFTSEFLAPRCNFREAIFLCDVYFMNTTFEQGADFSGCRFGGQVNFAGAEFNWRSEFGKAIFSRGANFLNAQFKGSAVFAGAIFGDGGTPQAAAVHFAGAKFGAVPREDEASVATVDFRDAEFNVDSSFVWAEFVRADFSGAKFRSKTTFREAKFKAEALFTHTAFAPSPVPGLKEDTRPSFERAIFTGQAVFHLAEFAQGANFTETIFCGSLDFAAATLESCVDFSLARFLGSVYFDRTAFRQKDLDPGPVFTQAYFEKPEDIVFQGTDLSHALFYNSDVTKVRFSDVTWSVRSNGKRKVFEEDVSLKHDRAQALKYNRGDHPRNYHLIAELYHQLKKNYDERQDPLTGGDFHYGEMEMRRIALHGGRTSLWRRHFGLIALYKYASAYGESYGRPIIGLGLVLLLFMLLFPVFGLDLNEGAAGGSRTPASTASNSDGRLDYGHFGRFLVSARPRGQVYATAAFFGHSLMTALSVAGFQKELKYEPSYPWGRAFALLEQLFTSTLIALFLLAVRRQFQR
jgi:uncharacterized protein YjbI with pentapeptide repeats